MNPLVTIAIPIYNAERYVKQAIISSLNQSYKEIELILINDGSTDNSKCIIDSFRDDPRVRIIDDGTNRGLISRLNESIELACGTFYARMDADDIMHPLRIERQVAALIANPRIDVVGSSIYSIDTQNKVRGVRYAKEHPSQNFVAHKCFAHPTVMGRIEWFRANHYSITALRHEDKELWTRTVGLSEFRNLTEPLLFYREVGITVYPKMLKSYRASLKMMRSSQSITMGQIKSIVVSTIKISIYGIFYLLRIEDILVLKRSKRLNKESRSEAEKRLILVTRMTC